MKYKNRFAICLASVMVFFACSAVAIPNPPQPGSVPTETQEGEGENQVTLDVTGCPQTGLHAFGLTRAISCLGYGDGNISGSFNENTGEGDPFLDPNNDKGAGAGYGLVSKYESDKPGEFESISLTTEDLTDYLKYTFTIEETIWDNHDKLAIGAKVGNKNGFDNAWAIWEIEYLATSFQLFVAPKQAASLSHLNIYGTPATAVPLPAAAWLFLSGLASIAGVRSGKRLLKKQAS